MTKHKSRFEDLPNELLTDIFKNFDARNLFYTFYNLNYRLNQLIKSFNYLELKYYLEQSYFLKTNNEIFSYYVHTLIINQWINVNLKYFTNIHCLKLNNPLPQVLEQLKPDILLNLEILTITYDYNMLELDLLRERIFSNRFLNLKICELYDKKSLITITNYSQSPTIKILKFNLINLIIYKKILLICPNLKYLKFSLNTINDISNKHMNFIHFNLEQLIIYYDELNLFYNNNNNNFILNEYLLCIPNLKKFSIHIKCLFENLKHYLYDYDWLSKIINTYLLKLENFKFYFSLLINNNNNENFDENILINIEKNFYNVHKYKYKAQIIIKRESI